MDARQQRIVQKRGWDRAVAHYPRYWIRQLEPAHAALLDMVAIAPGDRVLDVACGTGELTLEAAEIAGCRGSVVATDLAPKMVSATAAAADANAVTTVTTACCGAEELVVDGPFDVALCALGLMYVPDPPRALQEMFRVLRPGGRVALAVWGERRSCGWASVFGIVDSRVSTDVCPHFFALGAPRALPELLHDAGFDDVEERRLSVTLDYTDADDAAGAALLGGPVALAFGLFDAATRRAVVDDYVASLHPYRRGDGSFAVPGEFVVAVARRPL